MTTKYVAEGNVIQYTAGANIVSGQAVLIADGYMGVALADIASGSAGPVAVEGVFQMSKDGSDMAQGIKTAYLTTVTNTLSTATTSGTLVVNGRIVEAAGTGATTVNIRLF